LRSTIDYQCLSCTSYDGRLTNDNVTGLLTAGWWSRKAAQSQQAASVWRPSSVSGQRHRYTTTQWRTVTRKHGTTRLRWAYIDRKELWAYV